MKAKLIVGAIISVLSFACISNAQNVKAFKGTTFVPASDSDGFDIVTVSYTGLEDGSVRFLMATIPATTRDECFASRDLSTAVPVGQETAYSTYDPETNTTTHVWLYGLKNTSQTGGSASKPSCKLMLAMSGGRVDAADYILWRSSSNETASTSLREPEKLDSGRTLAQKSMVTSVRVTFNEVIN